MTCSHHYLIDPPSGPTSTGTCRLCGDEREFSNTVKGGWGEDYKRYAGIGPFPKPGHVVTYARRQWTANIAKEGE